jgi:predicted RNA-binding Zn-ribbon protein involved in translation (DUF1610 family)
MRILMEETLNSTECTKCKKNGIYAEYYDSYYCPDCNIWLDEKCIDATCEFCSKRPTFPKDKMGKVVNFYKGIDLRSEK